MNLKTLVKKIDKSTWLAISLFVVLALLVFLCSGCFAFFDTFAHDVKYRNDSVEFYYEIENFDEND